MISYYEALYYEAERIAEREGVSVGFIYTKWREAEENQKKWLQTLEALGWRNDEDLTDFLARTREAKDRF